MKTLKFALPVLAFLFAIVASFASVTVKDGTAPVYRFDVTSSGVQACILLNSNVCGAGTTPICTVTVAGQQYNVFDDKISDVTCTTLLRRNP